MHALLVKPERPSSPTQFELLINIKTGVYGAADVTANSVAIGGVADMLPELVNPSFLTQLRHWSDRIYSTALLVARADNVFE